MNVRNAKKWDEYKAANTDPYGAACVRFAEEWADEMEKRIAAGATLADFANATSHEVARRPGFGISGFMYGAAVSMLSQCWAHGEELRKWHNLETQIQDEGVRANKKPGAVLNPAVVVFGDKSEP